MVYFFRTALLMPSPTATATPMISIAIPILMNIHMRFLSARCFCSRRRAGHIPLSSTCMLHRALSPTHDFRGTDGAGSAGIETWDVVWCTVMTTSLSLGASIVVGAIGRDVFDTVAVLAFAKSQGG